MDWKTINFDWNRARAFLVTAEEGSLAAAARALDMTQPTLGRQVAALEAELGVELFTRRGRGLELTPNGMMLVEHVRAMGDAASLVSLTASGRSQTLEGLVCISASDAFSTYHLPALIRRLKDKAPRINIEIVASNELSDLRRREADIAIRHEEPKQPDLITKLVREPLANIYASKSYLENFGQVKSVDDLLDADFIGFENIDRSVSIYNQIGLSISKSNFKYNSGSVVVGWELVKQGLGMMIMSDEIALNTPNIKKVLNKFEPVQFPVWLTTHRELHTNRCIRNVYDHLAAELSS